MLNFHYIFAKIAPKPPHTAHSHFSYSLFYSYSPFNLMSEFFIDMYRFECPIFKRHLLNRCFKRLIIRESKNKRKKTSNQKHSLFTDNVFGCEWPYGFSKYKMFLKATKYFGNSRIVMLLTINNFYFQI